MGCRVLLQGIFPTQGPNCISCLGKEDSSLLSHQGSPRAGLVASRLHEHYHSLDGIMDPMDMSPSKRQEILKEREAWLAVVHGGCKELDMT